MPNISRERAPEKKKKKDNFFYEPVPSDEPIQGATDEELGTRWGLDKGTSNLTQKGRVTRKDTRTQQIPGGLEPAQDESEIRPGDTSLDQSGKPDGDRPSLDQPAQAGDDRHNLDQPARAGDDRLGHVRGEPPPNKSRQAF